ncbi:MAG: hypothetical protein AB7R67_20050 [Vicinamibacterales bacterium]
MSVDQRSPKGYRKAWDGGQRPEMPETAIGICTSCGGYIHQGHATCEPPCKAPTPFLLPATEAK